MAAKANSKSNSKSGPGTAGGKGRSAGGRTTPSGGSTTSARYTPPVARSVKKSSPLLGITILALFVVGVAVVILNYADLLPGGVDNVWLVVAIAVIFVGLILATRYR